MARKVLACIAGVGICVMMLVAGCATQADLSLEFTPNEVAVYKVSTDAAKGKDEVGTRDEVKFIQKIEGVDEKGNATIDIVIKRIIYHSKNKDGSTFDYDSKKMMDRNHSLGKLIGQSYKIKISPSGNVEVLDAEAVRNITLETQAALIAKELLSDSKIKERHRRVYLPQTNKKKPWSQIPHVDLAMRSRAGVSTTYNVKTEMIKDFKFEQPSLDKLREDQTISTIESTFVQQSETVEADGSAVANITIKEIKYYVNEKGDVKFEFDSTSEKGKSDPFARLIGKSYKIKISPAGEVTVVDAGAARKVVTSGYAGRVAKSFLDDKNIIKRHEILALPDVDKSTVSVGDSWKRIKASPPGLLSPKSYEKTYTVEEISGSEGAKVAHVTMNAMESAVAAEDAEQGAGSLGPFAKMFDTEDSFTGNMVIDLDSGNLDEYNEKLVVKYIVAEPSANQKPDKGPDTLMIRFTHSVSVKKVN
jgi:translation initiation factor 2 beta subunit (eIF-2beta)/eIF-5